MIPSHCKFCCTFNMLVEVVIGIQYNAIAVVPLPKLCFTYCVLHTIECAYIMQWLLCHYLSCVLHTIECRHARNKMKHKWWK